MLHGRISGRNQELGNLYWAAIEMLEAPATSSPSARHRLVMISHNLRELLHNAPVLFDDVAKPKRGRTDVGGSLKAMGEVQTSSGRCPVGP